MTRSETIMELENQTPSEEAIKQAIHYLQSDTRHTMRALSSWYMLSGAGFEVVAAVALIVTLFTGNAVHLFVGVCAAVAGAAFFANSALAVEVE